MSRNFRQYIPIRLTYCRQNKMIYNIPLIVVTIVCITGIYHCQAGRVSDKIYSPLQSNHYCSRRLNATHQVGCQSELGGNLGIVWMVENDNDLDHILKSGPTPPYVAILSREHFTRKNLLQFKMNLERVAGVIFLDRDHDDSKARGSSPFSPDDVCPNRHSGLYANDSRFSDCKVNVWQKESPISGLLYDDIPYPIFLINDKESSQAIHDCFKNHNLLEPSTRDSNQTKKNQGPYPLCGMQLDSFMLAASDSNLCLNSHSFVDDLLQSNGQRCYPVGNHNIFAYLKPSIGPLQLKNGSNLLIPDVTPKQSIVMLIAKLSSLSLFSDISPGADSTITSIVTLLTIAEALGRVRGFNDVVKSNRNIAFALIDSEPFDYTGSNRIVYNMQENVFPLNYSSNVAKSMMQNTNLTSIDYVINLDQMSSYPNSDSIFFHSNPDDENNEKLNHIHKIMERVASSEKVNLVFEDAQLPLPPTSVHQFINGSQDPRVIDKLVGIVLSNYGKSYNNLFYHSIYDDSHNVYQTSKTKLVEHIAQISRFIARSLYEITFNVEKSDNIEVDRKLVEQLLECYLIDAECHLFTRVWQAGQKLPKGPIQTYKDPTKRSDDMNGAITAHLLAYFIGDKINDYNVTECYHANEVSLEYNYQYINGKDEPISDASSGVCVKSQVTMLSAQSPAYSSNNDRELLIDTKYPAWTVSLNGIRSPIRLFLKPSPLSQWTILLLGIVTTLMSIIITYRIKDMANADLNDEVPTGTPT